jgi:hypothetical protein
MEDELAPRLDPGVEASLLRRIDKRFVLLLCFGYMFALMDR